MINADDAYAEMIAYWALNPRDYMADRLGMPLTWQQAAIVDAIVPEGAKVTVRSGHGIGKTADLAGIIYWFLECFEKSRIPITAPSSAQLRDVLFSELAKWMSKADVIWRAHKWPERFMLSKIFKITQDRVYAINRPKESFAVARTARPENPDALQGFHAANVTISSDGRSIIEDGDGGGLLFIVEEACFSDDTEILTDRGWSLFTDLNGTEKVLTMKDGVAFYEKPSAYYEYDHDGDMIEYQTRAIDFCITPNHKVWRGIRNPVANTYEWGFEEIGSVTNQRISMLRRFGWVGEHRDTMEIPAYRTPERPNKNGDQRHGRVIRELRVVDMGNWLDFLGWFLSEGSVQRVKGVAYSVVISQAKTDNRRLIAECVERLGFDPTIDDRSIRINDVQLATFLDEGKTASEKRVPRYVFDLTPSLILRFLNSYVLGDGYQKGERTIVYTSSKGMSDDLQILFLKAGEYASICVTKQAGVVSDFGTHFATSAYDKYVVGTFDSDMAAVRTIDMVRKHYKGKVHCVHVPDTHLVYVRRNGKCHWSGNSGVADKIYEVAEGALSSHKSRLLLVGNPTQSVGYFADSHKKNRAHFTPLHFRSMDSPLADPNYRANLVRKFGEGSNVVRVRADGEFPLTDDDVLIGIALTEPCLKRDYYHADERLPRIMGCDIARMGDDRTCFVLRQGRNILEIEVQSKQDLMVTVGQIIHFAKKWKADWINVDAVGMGAGVVDRLQEVIRDQELKLFVVAGINVAEKPEDDRTMFDGVDANPLRLRDQLWLKSHNFFRDEKPSMIRAPEDHANDLVGELSTVKYKIDSSGHLVMESKDDMKKPGRNLRSPDIADGLNLTFATNFMGVRARLI